MCAHNADAPLVAENTIETVSRDQGAPPSATLPPHRSSTVWPSTVMHTLAPSSPRFSKLSTKVSNTALNFGSYSPSSCPAVVPRETLLLLIRSILSEFAQARKTVAFSNRKTQVPRRPGTPKNGSAREPVLSYFSSYHWIAPRSPRSFWIARISSLPGPK